MENEQVVVLVGRRPKQNITVELKLEHLKNHALEMLETEGFVAGFIEGYKANMNDECYLIPMVFANEAEKQATIEVARMVFKEKKVTQYFLLTEGWVATAGKDDLDPLHPKVMPSDDPNRIEGVIIDYISYNRHIHQIYELKRDEHGEYQSLEPLMGFSSDSKSGDSVAGRMMQLLPPLQETKSEKTGRTVF